MHASAVLIVCLATQVLGAELGTQEKVGEYRAMVTQWSEAAARVVRSLQAAPAEEAQRVSQQLEDALQQTKEIRSKREVPPPSQGSEGLESFLANVNQGLKAFMSNVTSSPVYQQMQKFGDNFGEKGKELIGKVEEQLKNFQQSGGKSS